MAHDNDTSEGKGSGLKSLVEELPFDRLKDELQDMVKALGDKALDSVSQRLDDATDSLGSIADGGGILGKVAGEGTKAAAKGDNPVGGALKGGLGSVKDKVASVLPGGGGSGSGKSDEKATKSTNIIESIDVGVPIDVAYNQWTQFQDFSGFMKKVEDVDQENDTTLTFKAQVFWSHRTWQAKIIDQVPNDRIIWRSKGEKGHVDGAVTFHELAPNLTRILIVLEYYPQGLFERTGNLWRAQGRRARLELKHFRRHVMTRSILDQDELEGWRGEIHDSEVERDHDEVVEEEQEQEGDEGSEEPEGEYDEEPEDADEDDEPRTTSPRTSEDEPEDEYEDDEPEDDEPEDEYEEEEEEPEAEEDDAEEEPEDEYEEPEEEDEPEDELEDEEPEEEDEPEDEPEEEPEGEEEDEDDEEPEDDEPVDEDEPEEKPRRRSARNRRSSRSGR